MAAAATLVTGAVGLAAYVNAKLAIGMDLDQLRKDRSFGKRLGALVEKMGDRMTLYHMLELADQRAEALWFEGQTWTYAELKVGKSKSSFIPSCGRLASNCQFIEADRAARILKSKGVQVGERVAILMNNSPEMVFAIYGTHKLGASPALINAALRGQFRLT